MQRRTLVNVVLAGIVAALAAIALLQPGRSPPPAPRPIASIDAQTVRTITIERPDQPDILMERDEGNWWLHAPLAGPANPVRIDTLLELPATRTVTRLEIQPGELGRYGLAPPRASVSYDDLTIDVGDTQPLDGRRYVRVGTSVFLVHEMVYAFLVSHAAEFMRPDLVDPGAQLTAIVLPDRALELRDGHWRVVSGAPLEDAGVQATVRAWQQTRAVRVAARDERAAQATITLEFVGGARVDYDVLATTPLLELGRVDRGVRYQIDGPSAARLLAKPQENTTATAP